MDNYIDNLKHLKLCISTCYSSNKFDKYDVICIDSCVAIFDCNIKHKHEINKKNKNELKYKLDSL